MNVLIHVPDQEHLNFLLKILGIARYTADTTKENQIEFDFDDPIKTEYGPPKKLRKQIEKIVQEGGGVSLSPKGKQKYCDDCKKQYEEQGVHGLRRG